jgi:HK97 family phage major capsid protein
MSDRGISDLLHEIKLTRDVLAAADAERIRKFESKADKGELDRLSADMVQKTSALQAAVTSISLRLGRPGGSATDANAVSLRENAKGLLESKYFNSVTKNGNVNFNPSSEELDEAEVAISAMKRMMKITSLDQLSGLERKALSNFNLGASGFLLPPEMSSRILSCLVEPSDVASLMSNITIAGPSIQFMVDEVVAVAAWACETSCFANNPQPNLTEGLGQLEIKAETIRYVACTSGDILSDSAVNIEAWLFAKVAKAFRALISSAIMVGDGIGKPLGILNVAAGIPICDTSANTPAGQFTWQDLISLKFAVPLQYHSSGVYLCNQNTFGLLLTMSDALGRPLMIAMPTDVSQYYINGSPVRIVSQMPDCAPGATPMAFGDWNSTYMVVTRKSVAMQHDPYSSGFCHLFKFEGRVGGGVICPNASRLLRIK